MQIENQNMYKLIRFRLIGFILLIVPNLVLAQGDGPRSYLLGPVNLFGVTPKYLDLNQNLVPAGTIYLEDSDINVNVFPTTLFYNFKLNGNFAQVQFMINPGSANGFLVADNGVTLSGLDNSGFSDGFVAIKYGLVGTPALSIQEFATKSPGFSLVGYLRLWYSGSYDENDLLNLGTNRWTIEFGPQISFPLSKKTKRPIWVESYPYVQFFTVNSDPTALVSGDEVTQKPVFGAQNHITYNFTKKFWAGIDINFRIGGESKVDGVAQDNPINALGGGLSAGYQILPFLQVNTSYGEILAGDSGLNARMFRLGMVLVYAKTKKQ